MKKMFKNKFFIFLFFVVMQFGVLLFPMVESTSLSLPASSFDATREEHIDLRLKGIAEGDGFGYKTANLILLRDEIFQDEVLFQKLKTLNCSVAVPRFMGIPHKTIMEYLLSKHFDPVKEWGDLKKKFLPPDFSTTQHPLNIPKEFEDGVESIGKEIKNIFLNEKDDDVKTIIDTEIENILKEAQAQNCRFIVRSTGMEDKKGLANAGGNESIKNVEPTRVAIFQAIGLVIESYFGLKSLRQRLLAGDKTVFDLPSMPVLIQEMVVAKRGEKRPIECVVHTQEQSGPTKKLASLNCGYDVVGSSQRADLCYYFHMGGGYCSLNEKIEHLPENVRQAIAMIAAHVESFYQRATDMELLVTRESDSDFRRIWVVQARPLNRPSIIVSPSYIKNPSIISKEKIIPCTTVVAAGSCVKNIRNRNHIVVAPTLAEALYNYLFDVRDKKSIQAIVVGREAEPNSHEATIFASDGKIVMIANDYGKFVQWMDSDSLNVYLDVQQELVINGSLEDSIAIVEGYITHPTSLKISIPDAVDTGVEEDTTLSRQLSRSTIEFPYEAIYQLKNAPEPIAARALSIILDYISREKRAIEQVEKSSSPTMKSIISDAVEKLKAIKNYAKSKANIITMVLRQPTREDNTLERLAAIKPLEALLSQRVDPTLVRAWSVQNVLDEFYTRRMFVMTHLPSDVNLDLNLLDIANNGFEVALSESIEKSWLTFIENVSRLPSGSEQRKNFESMIKVLNTYNIMSLWINTIFQQKASLYLADFDGLFDELVHNYDKDAELLLLSNLKVLADTLVPAMWVNPEKFEKNIHNLEDMVTKFTDDLVRVFETDNILFIAAVLSTMNMFVDNFDRSIKSFKTSSCADVEKVARFG